MKARKLFQTLSFIFILMFVGAIGVGSILGSGGGGGSSSSDGHHDSGGGSNNPPSDPDPEPDPEPDADDDTSNSEMATISGTVINTSDADIWVEAKTLGYGFNENFRLTSFGYKTLSYLIKKSDAALGLVISIYSDAGRTQQLDYLGCIFHMDKLNAIQWNGNSIVCAQE